MFKNTLRLALLGLVLLSGVTPSRAQARPTPPNFLKERFLQGRWLAGAGLTGAGLSGKAGTFVREGLWVGLTANAQLSGVFNRHLHAGMATRYYVARGRDFSFFAEGGLAYGHFNVYQWSRTEEAALASQRSFFSGNLHYDLGADLWMTRQVSIEGSLRRNHLLASGDALPGVNLALNYFF